MDQDNDSDEKVNKIDAYIETVDGEAVSYERAAAMRKRARELWQFLDKQDGAPRSWGNITFPHATYYRNAMCESFPELRLCENNWKVNHLATIHYSKWSNRRPSVKKIKEEEKTTKMEEVEASMIIPAKRPSGPEPKRKTKKTKVDKLHIISQPIPIANTGFYSFYLTSSSY